MAKAPNPASNIVPIEEIQRDWGEVHTKVRLLEAEKAALEGEVKALRFLLERVIEHRQKSHAELVLLLTGLVSKLPINDIGTIVARLMEHNTNCSHMLAALGKGTTEAVIPQPTVLKALDDTKRELLAAIKPAVDELIRLDTSLEKEILESLVKQPELFFSSRVVRANRCFVKGLVLKERVLKEFGSEALTFFNDVTTDPKLNPRPKQEEIVLAFKPDFEALLQQQGGLPEEKKQLLRSLHQRVQRSKGTTDEARLQKTAFHRLSFLLELLHFYENQNTEAPDVLFAQRLPALIEQLALSGTRDTLDEKSLSQAEALLAHIINPDHRMMVVFNVGKGGGVAKTLHYVFRLRAEKIAEQHQVILDFIRHLLPARLANAPSATTVAAILKLIKPPLQRQVVKAILLDDRFGKDEAMAYGKVLAAELGITGVEEEIKVEVVLSPDAERQMAWDKIKALIVERADPNDIATVIRDRLHAKYDADEIKQSWLALTEADPISLIRVFCHLPYLADGRTDPVARAVMESYASRLIHEKYLTTYNRVVNSLRNMYKANPQSPTLLNFIALVKWVDPAAANKITADVGMAVAV